MTIIRQALQIKMKFIYSTAAADPFENKIKLQY